MKCELVVYLQEVFHFGIYFPYPMEQVHFPFQTFVPNDQLIYILITKAVNLAITADNCHLIRPKLYDI